MKAIIQRHGSILEHSWPVDDHARQDGDDVVVDGYRIEDCDLVEVQA